MKFQLPSGVTQFNAKDGSIYIADINGQVTISDPGDIADVLNAGNVISDSVAHALQHDQMGLAPSLLGANYPDKKLKIPLGLDSWKTDTFLDFDIYQKGFVKSPTMFYDPSNTNSLGWGTFKQPYTTVEQLGCVLRGNMAGQVLGFKRGTKSSAIILGANYAIYGTSAAPFYMVPYGDASALPIISGARAYAAPGGAGWQTTANARVYSLTIGTEYDVWENALIDSQTVTRMWKVSTSGIVSAATAIAAVDAAGAGNSMYYSGVLYIRPYNASPDWTKIELGVDANALQIAYANVAATGYINIVGLHCRTTRDTVINIIPFNATGNIVTIDSVGTYGCKLGQAGFDASSSLDRSCFIFKGIATLGGANTILATNIVHQGNYKYDAINGACVFEFGVSSGLIDQNLSAGMNGVTVAELYGLVSGVTVQRNRGDGRFGGHAPVYQFGNRGIWEPGFDLATVGNETATKDPSKNSGNKYYLNVMLNLQGPGIEHCGATGLAYHNVMASEFSPGVAGDPTVRQNDGTTNHSSALALWNNILLSSDQTDTVYGEANTTFTSQFNYMMNANNGFSATLGGVGGKTINDWNTSITINFNYSLVKNPLIDSNGIPDVNNGVYNSVAGAAQAAGVYERGFSGKASIQAPNTLPQIGAYSNKLVTRAAIHPTNFAGYTATGADGVYTVTASSEFNQTTLAAWHCFDGNVTTEFATNGINGSNQFSVILQLPVAKIATSVKLINRQSQGETSRIKAWKIQGSNNGLAFTDLLISNMIIGVNGAAPWPEYEITFLNSTAYTYYGFLSTLSEVTNPGLSTLTFQADV